MYSRAKCFGTLVAVFVYHCPSTTVSFTTTITSPGVGSPTADLNAP